MLGWHLTRGKSEEMGQPEYDKEVSHNHLPRLTSRQDVSRSSLSVYNIGVLGSDFVFFYRLQVSFLLPRLNVSLCLLL